MSFYEYALVKTASDSENSSSFGDRAMAGALIGQLAAVVPQIRSSWNAVGVADDTLMAMANALGNSSGDEKGKLDILKKYLRMAKNTGLALTPYMAVGGLLGGLGGAAYHGIASSSDK